MIKKLLISTAVIVATTQMAAAADLSSMSWDDVVTQAKEEGELTWYVWYLTDDLRRAAKTFEEEYSITVIIPEGTMEGNLEKLYADKARKTGDIDVFALGWDSYTAVDLASVFMPLTVLPKDNNRVSDLTGIDAGEYALAFWGNQTGIAYDPAHVSGDALPQTPKEFSAFWQDHPEKFGFNYQNGGAGPSYYQNILRVVSGADFSDPSDSKEHLAALQPGIDFFNAHAENYVITASNADSITRISDGELWMAPAWEDHLAGLQNRGEVRKDIKFYIPEMGMNGGGNGVSIPLNAPHSAAAAVFINWLISPETQTVFNKEFGTAPMNAAADDSFALIPNAMRKYSTISPNKPFRSAMEAKFTEEVVQQR